MRDVRCVGRRRSSRFRRRLAHADTLARAVNLDMAAAGWSPTVDNYLGRVPKARILEAVREGKGEASAEWPLSLNDTRTQLLLPGAEAEIADDESA